MKKMIPLLAALIVLPALGHAEDAHSDHLASLGDLRLVHAWARATEADNALVFVEIENGSDAPVTLRGGESALAASVEVVGFQLQGEGGSYVSLGEVVVAAKTTLELAPERVALRLNGLSADLHPGETFPMEVDLSTGHLQVVVEVEAEDALSHSHAGHQH